MCRHQPRRKKTTRMLSCVYKISLHTHVFLSFHLGSMPSSSSPFHFCLSCEFSGRKGASGKTKRTVVLKHYNSRTSQVRQGRLTQKTLQPVLEGKGTTVQPTPPNYQHSITGRFTKKRTAKQALHLKASCPALFVAGL